MFYRWRRTLLTLLAVVGVGTGLAVLGHNPAGLARGLWHDLRGDVVRVQGVQAVAMPPDSVAASSSAEGAVDEDVATAWSTSWKAPASPPPCGEPNGGGVLQLTMPATRIRELRVVNGLTDPSRRSLQLLPMTLHVTSSDGTCVAVPLTTGTASQTVAFDTQTPVTSVTIYVAATYPATDARAAPVVSLSEVSLWARPD